MSINILEQAQTQFVAALILAVRQRYGATVPQEMEPVIMKCMSRPRTRGTGEFMFPCSSFCKLIPGVPNQDIASACSDFINNLIETDQQYAKYFDSASANGAYVNLKLSSKFFASVVDSINHGSFLSPLPHVNQEKVMIEYSQPNTHKVFHVGHMRNVALGGSVIRLYEQMGHEVVAATYPGDEGAHIGKCLWRLQQIMAEKGVDLAGLQVPKDSRGEFLGKIYIEANDQLDLRTLTRYPFANVIAARILTVNDHPVADAPKTWHVCTVDAGQPQPITVVCGGIGYKVGDMVAYIPLGSKLKKQLIVPKDFKGVNSSGMILAYSELGLSPPADIVTALTKESDAPVAAKGKGGKKAGGGIANQIICVIPEECQPGEPMIEIGKIDKSVVESVMEQQRQKKKEVDDILLKLENGEEKLCELWKITRQWSLDDFNAIYDWLEARFDHWFFESEVSEESKELVMANYKLTPEEGGVMMESNGAIGCDLSKSNPPLPFLVLIKSNGAGLYATKDLSLAQRKFGEFEIERSVYVVDSGQSLHFQQVFACLDLLGYEQAKKCFHLSYGQVVGPQGKMSSRDGSIIYFSQLKAQLTSEIMETYLKKYVGVWDAKEIDTVCHAISLATIKYRMLNQDPVKDIVFVLKDWTAKTGDTGPYLCYAYARIMAIIAKVSRPANATVDLSLLDTDHDRTLLYAVNNFWSTIEKATYEYKPSILCKYLFDLSKDFNSWYEITPVNEAASDDLKATRLEFISAIAAVIKRCLFLLGINAVERM